MVTDSRIFYTCELTYMVNGKALINRILHLVFVNTVPSWLTVCFILKMVNLFLCKKGGNWGMSEYMLRCRGEEYDLKLETSQ